MLALPTGEGWGEGETWMVGGVSPWHDALHRRPAEGLSASVENVGCLLVLGRVPRR